MPGVFEIHPTGGSTIVCDTLDTIDTAEHLLISVDLKESEREKIVYSEGKFDGSVIDSMASIVSVEFVFLVNGDTPEEVAGNLAVLKAAFFNLKGGYVEYRPIGYDASVLTTFYKYLQSPPPQRLREEDAVQSSVELAFGMGQLYRFQIKVFSLATSDPDTLQSIVSGTIYNFLQNGDDANKSTGYLLIPASSIKGDGFIPNIGMTHVDSGVTNTEDVLIHIYKCSPSEAGKEFFNEASSGFSSYTDDDRHVMSSVSSTTLMFPTEADTPDLYGRVAPVFSYQITNGSWEYSIGYSSVTLTDWVPLDPTRFWTEFDLEIASTIQYPYFHVPPGKTIGITSLELRLRTTDSSPHTMSVYGLFLLKVDDGAWIARFQPLLQGAVILFTIDGHDGSNYLYYQPTNTASASYPKQGDPIKSLIFPKSDYQFRLLFWSDTVTPGPSKGWHHEGPSRMSVTITGVFYTIYPFAVT